MPTIKACLFDLDGVIVDTAKYHFVAWRQLANSLGIDFTEKENEKLKGVGRAESLDLILEWGAVRLPAERKRALMAEKNELYLTYVDQMKVTEILPGIMPLLDELAARGIRVGLGSASKNARRILNRLNIIDRFEVIIDGTKTTKGKPDPQVFHMGAEGLEVLPEETIVFEDAGKGVEAARRGGFYAVGIGDEATLGAAHFVTPDLNGWTFDRIVNRLESSDV